VDDILTLLLDGQLSQPIPRPTGLLSQSIPFFCLAFVLVLFYQCEFIQSSHLSGGQQTVERKGLLSLRQGESYKGFALAF
jgi:hypothetical protein